MLHMPKNVLRNLKSNSLFLVFAAFCLYLLTLGGLSTLPKWLWIFPALGLLAAAAAIPKLLRARTSSRRQALFQNGTAGVCGLLCGLDLYFALPQNARWTSLFADRPNAEILCLSLFAAVTTLVWTVLLSGLFAHIPASLSLENVGKKGISLARGRDIRTAAFCLVTAFVVLTVCTKSSFLYPLNDWVDSNCFFTVGKALMNGKVLYADIYEQKGPILYFLHGLCYLLSRESFFGVYLLELLAAAAFLFFAAKTVFLYTTRGIYVWLPLFAAAVFTSRSFCHGDSAEELCLPLLMLTVYLGERAFRRGELLPWRHWMCVGIAAGIVLWIKFNILGFFVGWALIPLYQSLRKGGFAALCKAALGVLAGVGIASIPVFVYFALHHAFGALWEAYFYNNLFLYAGLQTESGTFTDTLLTLFFRMRSAVCSNYLYAVPGVAGVVWYALTVRGERRLHMPLAALLLAICVFPGQLALPYYSLVLAVFAVWGMAALCKATECFLPRQKPWLGRTLAAASLCAACLVSFLFSQNVYLMKIQKADMPQYKFREIILSIDDPTLLNYGFLDGGFYTTTGLVPQNRFFCRLNIPLEEMYSVQDADVLSQQTDFIVTRSTPLQAAGYSCVAQSSLYFEGWDFTYYLYASDRVLPQLLENGVLEPAYQSLYSQDGADIYSNSPN